MYIHDSGVGDSITTKLSGGDMDMRPETWWGHET